MRFSLLSLMAATLFLSLLVGANLTPERVNDGPAEQRDYGWPFFYCSEWGPRTK